MIQLNYRDAKPIYEQIQEGFRKMILTGTLKPDEKLPSVRSLASELAINPNTIQRAYNQLESQGYIYSVSGKGSFVNGAFDPQSARRQELLQRLLQLALELRYLNISREEILRILEEEGSLHD